MTDSASDLPTVDCRFKGEHSTIKCSYEDILQSTMDQTNEKRSRSFFSSIWSCENNFNLDESVPSTMNITTSQGQHAASELTDKILGKCVSMSAGGVAVETKCSNERGETRSSGYTERRNKRRKQGWYFFSLQLTKSIVHWIVDETTDQLTNLPNETE